MIPGKAAGLPLRERILRSLAPPNSSRVHLDAWVGAKAQAFEAGRRVLDAGAGEGMYAPLFSHAEYESADFGQVDKTYIDLTYVCDLTAIPVEDGRFDAVLCSQVLEHVRHPDLVLAELHRVLRPGGELWLTAPLFFEEHEQPYDYFRYTQFALRSLFEEAGFDVVSIEWLEGYLGTLAHQCTVAARALPLKWLPARLLFLILGHALSRSDQRRKLTTAGMCKNYSVTAVKRDRSSG